MHLKGKPRHQPNMQLIPKKRSRREIITSLCCLQPHRRPKKVHANNHKSVIVELGGAVPNITPEFTVKTTGENLQDAIEGESYEVTAMYPDFLQDAANSKTQLAQISFNYAFEVEKKHQTMYRNALLALNNNTVNELPNVYYICPTCGNTYDQTPSERCGISMTGSEKFIKINSL